MQWRFGQEVVRRAEALGLPVLESEPFDTRKRGASMRSKLQRASSTTACIAGPQADSYIADSCLLKADGRTDN